MNDNFNSMKNSLNSSQLFFIQSQHLLQNERKKKVQFIFNFIKYNLLNNQLNKMMLILILFHFGNCCVFQFQFNKTRSQQFKNTALDVNMNKVYIIWTKYYPFIDDYSTFPVNYNAIIFREQDAQQNDLLFYTMQIQNGLANHYVTLRLTGITITQQFTLDIQNDQYEGRWVMLYVFYYYAYAKIYLGLHANGNPLSKLQFQSFDAIQTSTSGYTIYDSIQNFASIFQGYIQVITPDGSDSYFTTTQQLYDALQVCQLPQQCVLGQFNQMNLLVSSIMDEFQQQGITQVYSDGYSISGWFIFTPKSKLTYQAYLIKLIQYGLEYDYSNGIQALTMFVNYDTKNPNSGGIQVQTYSYETPQWFENLTPNNGILKVCFSEDYQNNILKWTYFRFITGPDISTQLIPGTSQYTILNTEIFFGFSQNQYNIQYTIPQKLNQYRYGNLSIYIGNSPQTINPFIGKIANLQFTTCLNQYSIPSQQCHFTCFVCNGPQIDNCLECPLLSNRYILNNRCECELGFIQADNDPICKLITDYIPDIQILTLSSQQQAGTCIQGYFFESKSQKCYQWQLFDLNFIISPQQITSGTIYCGDCLDHPQDWYYQLNCTYDYIQYDGIMTNAFYKQQRDSQNYDLYIFVGELPQYSLIFFEGAQSYCLDLTLDECNEVKYYDKTSSAVCSVGYYYFQLSYQCQQCLPNCKSCRSYLMCNQCKVNYYLFTDQLKDQYCLECPFDCVGCQQFGTKIKCTSCRVGYSLQPDYSCQICGNNCKSCKYDSQYQINRCLVCNQQYFLMLDGINCSPLSIDNCLQQYQEVNQLYVKVNTIRMNYPPQSQDNAQTYCALCEDYYINTLVGCQFADSTIDKMQVGDQIVQFNGAKTYLRYQIDTSKQTQPQYCYQIQFCSSCIQRGRLYCLECVDGYYPHLFNGECIQCPTSQNCLTCYMENKDMEDQWKWKIRLFYQYRFDSYSDFLVQSVTNNVADYPVICSSCSDDYELYNKQCILKCASSCASCTKINNQNVCSSCYTLDTLQPLSVYNNTCIKCPSNCILCQPRTQQQQNSINPYFNPDNPDLLFYSHICLKPTIGSDLFYNQNLGQYVKCSNSQFCEKQVTLNINGYCSDDDFQSILKPLSGVERKQFLMLNVQVSTLFSISLENHFKTIEDSAVLDYMNTQLNKPCYILIEVDQQIQLLLQKISLIMTCQDQQFGINDQVSFIGFTEVQINHCIIKQDSQIYISHQSQVKFIFQDSKIIQGSRYFLNFIIQNPINILLQRLDITNMTFQQCQMFQYSVNNTQISTLNIEMNSIKLELVNFINSSLIDIKNYIQNQKTNIIINDLQLLKLNIIQNSSIIKESDFNNQESRISLNNIKFYNSIFKDSIVLKFNLISVLINSEGSSQKLQFELIQLINSTFIMVKQLKLFNGNFTNFNLTGASILVDGSGQIETNYINSITLNSCVFQNIIFSLTSNLILLKQNKQLSEFHLEKSTLSNYKILLNQVNMEQVYSYHLYGFIYISYHKAYIKQCNFERSTSYQDILFKDVITIEIQELKVKGNYIKGLHDSFECIQKSVNFQNYSTFIHIQNVTYLSIQNSNFQNMLISLNPLIRINLIDPSILSIISVSQTQFVNNLLIVANLYGQTGLIHLSSQNEALINIMQSTFKINVMNNYLQNFELISASTLLIEAIQSIVNINDTIFDKNFIFNTTDAVIVIHSKQLQIYNSQFINNNLYDDVLIQFVVWNIQDTFVQESFILKFPVKSIGGAIKYQGSNFVVANSQFIKSTAQIGAGLYLQIQNSTSISNSVFKNLRNDLSQTSGQGAGVYISFNSAKGTLNVQGCNFSQISSFAEGGAFYIDSTFSATLISFSNINFINVYSFIGSLIYSQQNIGTQINLDQISVTDNFSGFRQYLDQFINIENQEYVKFQAQNQLIFVQQGSVTIDKFNVNYLYLKGVLKCLQTIKIIINNMLLENINLGSNNIIEIYPYNYLATTIIIKSLKIINAQAVYNTSTYCTAWQKQFKVDFQCNDVEKIPKTLNIGSSARISPRTDCFLQGINYFTPGLYLLFIEKVSAIDQITISDLVISNVNCTYCFNGMIRIQQIQLIQNVNETQNINIQSISLSNNICGLSCIIFTSNLILNLSQISTNNTRILSEFDKSQYLSPITVKLSQSTFDQNQLQYGTLLFDGVSVLISDCVFKNNSAQYAGGAIYFQGTTNQTLNLFSSQINNNSAAVGGALYLKNYLITDPTLLQLVLESNKATIYGSDNAQNPVSLSISTDRGQNIRKTERIISTNQQIVDQVIIEPYYVLGNSFQMFPSGQKLMNYQYYNQTNYSYISYNLSLRLIALDKFRQPQKQLSNQICYLQQRIVNISSVDESVLFASNSISINITTFNLNTLDFNLDELVVDFNPYQSKDLVLQLQFKCPFINIPLINDRPPYNPISYVSNYELRLNIQTFQCQMGEIFIPSNGTCILCDSSQQQYSVNIRNQCQVQDEVSTQAVKPAQIQLKIGYWRPFDSSTVIENCLHLETNCQGGWYPGDDSCALGHIGALCEQCDLYNIRGNGQYSVSTAYSCGSCEQISGNSLTITAISIWTLISILMSVRGTLEMVDQIVGTFKALALGLVVAKESEGAVAILMKILTNYLQIISSISTFQLKLPSAFDNIFNSVGNPVQSMSYSLDCFLVSASSIQILYFRMIWALIMPLFYICIFFTAYYVAIFLEKTKYNVSVISTTLIYMYLYLQPNLIGGLISLLSFRFISEIYWVQGNVSYKYTTSIHFKWIIGFVMPSLIVLALIIPFYLLRQLQAVKHKLDDIDNVKLWGYLYNEYRHQSYYWEIVKIFQKTLIIIFLTFYEDLIVIKASLVFLVIFMYDLFTKSKKPYKLKNLNSLDEESSLICAFSIVIGMTIYNANNSGNQEIVWPFYLLIAVFNIYFLIKLILILLWGHINTMRDELDLVRNKINEKFPKLQEYHPLIKRLLKNSHEQKKRVKKRFQSIKKFLMPLAKEIVQLETNAIITIYRTAQIHPQKEQQIQKELQIENIDQNYQKHTQKESQNNQAENEALMSNDGRNQKLQSSQIKLENSNITSQKYIISSKPQEIIENEKIQNE
ncbi:hypothetical protein pb186bvf_013770 [Paramecium bursaria]